MFATDAAQTTSGQAIDKPAQSLDPATRDLRKGIGQAASEESA